MRTFIVETAFTDGWRCERHVLCATSVNDACEQALAAAGSAVDAWVSCEAGGTVIEAVRELDGVEERIHEVPDELAGDGEPPGDHARARHQRDLERQLVAALTRLAREAGHVASVAALAEAAAALRAAERWHLHPPLGSAP
jgi:hypothetical protein